MAGTGLLGWTGWPWARGQRLAAVSLAAWLVGTLVLPLAPVVGVPGYEQALVSSALLPFLLPPWLLWVARRAPGWGDAPGLTSAAVGGLTGALPALWTGLWGWAGGWLCHGWAAAAFVVLGPVASGVLLGACARLAVVAWPGGRWAWVVLGVILAGGMGHTGWVLYAEPQVFMLDHFLSWLRGPLYDEGTAAGWERPLALRAMTVAWAALALSVAHARTRPGRGAWLAVAGTAGLAWVVGDATGAVRRPGRAALEASLGTVVRTPGAVIRLDGAKVGEGARVRLALEVERHVVEIREALGTNPGPPVTVFLYPSAEEKGRLVGARSTLVARPWAREVHVQGVGVPVGALRHELVHALSAELAGWPFRVPTTAWVVPRLLLVEGLAVALEEEGGELTLMERAAVMRRMGRLPPLEVLDAPWGFLLESGPRAYTAAGAFLRFLAQTRGPGVLGRIYRAGTVEVLGEPREQLEAAWHAHLDRVPVAPEVSSDARRVFSAPALLERRCADLAADLWEQGRAAADQGRLDDAEAAWREVLALDVARDGPLRALLEAASRHGDQARAGAVAAEILDRSPDNPTRAAVLMELALARARVAEVEAALEGVGQALALAESAAARRPMQALALALEVMRDQGPRSACGTGALGVLRFLFGHGAQRARGRTDLLALERARLSVPVGEGACGGKGAVLRGLLAYLVGRQVVAEDPDLAEEMLREGLGRGLPSPLFEVAAWELRGEAHEVAGRFARAEVMYRHAEVRAEREAEREGLRSRARRAAFADRHQHQGWVMLITGRGGGP
jgi:tetratricopeptide (TPR) repeat protein